MRGDIETKLTEAVIARLANDTDPRFRQLMESLIRHLHDFIRDVELTEEEWFEAIKFLTATGHKSDDKRQEFILLSDVLGASMLVDAINHRREAGATENTVLGPFFVHGAPLLENGDDMAAGWKGDPTFVSGRVLSTSGQPVGGATIDLWQSNSEGWYDVQLAETGGKQLRGTLKSEADGRYWFRTILPTSYPVPTDGPVGLVLTRMGRHPMRPAHLHFMITAPGFETTVTHLFVKGDRYLESDTVFGVKDSLVVDFKRSESEAEATRVGLKAPFFSARYDFVLLPTRDEKTQQVVRTASDAVKA